MSGRSTAAMSRTVDRTTYRPQPDTAPPRTIHPREFRRALGRFASGVTVITTEAVSGVHGMTANAVLAVSLEPPLVLVSLSTGCRMADLLPATGRYGISVLGAEDEPLSSHFAGRGDREARPEFEWAGDPALPFLRGALAKIGCCVVDVHPAGDHLLFIARVVHLDFRDGEPLVFYTGSHRSLRVGLSDDPFTY